MENYVTSPMESFECDVVIIGAGLSGLSAAYYLSKKDRGLRVIVLEAKDRIGGRTLTKQLTAADGTKDFWDLGGEWVGRPQPHLQYLLKKFHIDTFNPISPKDGGCVKFRDQSWKTRLDLAQFTWKLRRLQKQIEEVEDLKSKLFAIQWDSSSFESYVMENLWTEEAKNVIDAACRCMFGLAPSEMTLLYFLKYIKSAGGLRILVTPAEYAGGECRIKGGVQQLANYLVNAVRKKHVYLNQPVLEIVQSVEGSRIRTSNGMYILCQRVIMAIPPHHTAAISYKPPLPAVKLGLLESVPLAFLVKFAITYEEAFWHERNGNHQYGFQAVLEDKKLGPIGFVYDASSGRGNPALSGFISCPEQLDFDPKNRRSFILKLLESMIGPNCHKFLEFSLKDWSTEPYNGGCFLKSLMPGTTRYFNTELRDPFDRIHFAGTETATVWCGFMNGAIQSGFRAASEILYHLRPLIIASPYPDTLHQNKDEEKEEASYRLSYSVTKWAALGIGVASAAFFVLKTRHIAPSAETFVKNIRLVFEPGFH